MKFILLVIINLKFIMCSGQVVANNVRILPASTIDWNTPSALPVDSLFGDLKILMMSESDHGERSSFEAQCLLLKKLIDNESVNVVFIEANWINIAEIVRMLKEEGAAALPKTKAIMNTVGLRYWIQNGFWSYLSQKIIDGKISLIGSDIDGLSGELAHKFFEETRQIESVRSFFSDKKSEFEKIQFEYKYFSGWSIQSNYNYQRYQSQKKYIDLVLKHYESKNDFFKVKVWKTILNFFYWMAERGKYLNGNKYSNQIVSDKQFTRFHQSRDSLMAEIFLQYYNANPDLNYVGLLSSYHALKNPKEVEGIYNCCMDSSVHTMAQVLTKKYGLKIKNLTFISGSGEYGVNFRNYNKKSLSQVPAPVKGSLEAYLFNLNYPYCLVDITSANESFYMRTEFNTFFRSGWNKNFDYLFFIRKMSPLLFETEY